MKSERGQAILEYVLLLSIVVFMFGFAIRTMRERDWFQNLVKPLTKIYPDNYQYGYYNPNSPNEKFVPQDPDSSKFRVFVNPSTE